MKSLFFCLLARVSCGDLDESSVLQHRMYRTKGAVVDTETDESLEESVAFEDEQGESVDLDSSMVGKSRRRKKGSRRRRRKVTYDYSCPAGSHEGCVGLDVPNFGRVAGTTSADDISTFLGIRYATAARFERAVPAGAWNALYNASDWGAGCMSKEKDASESEDCLFLNIATPRSLLNARKASSRKPVMIYIHGGAHKKGSGKTVSSSGGLPLWPLQEHVVNSGMKILSVSINFRLGPFGFMGDNYGLYDQQTAFKWVRDNIRVFGGNGAEITVFGGSSGGNGIYDHLVMPTSAGLFQKAVLQSAMYNFTGSRCQDSIDAVLDATGCADVACVTALDAVTLRDTASTKAPSRVACIDGVELTDSPWELIKTGNFMKIPLILGATAHEDNGYSRNEPWNGGDRTSLDFTEAQFDAKYEGEGLNVSDLKDLYGFDTDYPFYPDDLADRSTWWWMSGAIESERLDDQVTGGRGHGYCGSRLLAQHLLQHGGEDIYMYMHAIINEDAYPYARHTQEKLFIMGASSLLNENTTMPQQATQIGGYWSTFAETGVPSNDWQKFELLNDRTMVFKDESVGPIAMENDVLQDQCDFWESLCPTQLDPP